MKNKKKINGNGNGNGKILIGLIQGTISKLYW